MNLILYTKYSSELSFKNQFQELEDQPSPKPKANIKLTDRVIYLYKSILSNNLCLLSEGLKFYLLYCLMKITRENYLNITMIKWSTRYYLLVMKNCS